MESQSLGREEMGGKKSSRGPDTLTGRGLEYGGWQEGKNTGVFLEKRLVLSRKHFPIFLKDAKLFFFSWIMISDLINQKSEFTVRKKLRAALNYQSVIDPVKWMSFPRIWYIPNWGRSLGACMGMRGELNPEICPPKPHKK